MDARTVLCIDDCPQLLELRKAILQSHGYHVKIALSGHVAIKMLAEMPVDAVLLEYKSEGLDAEAVASHLKSRFPSIPIVLLSAYACMPERILWLVDEYVMKSELTERLLPAIERVVCRSKPQGELKPASRCSAAEPAASSVWECSMFTGCSLIAECDPKPRNVWKVPASEKLEG